MGNNGLTTIEEVKETFDRLYNITNDYHKIELKSWLNHSESRVRNGNSPFTLNTYSIHMTPGFLIEQIKLGILDCSDIGTEEDVIEYIENLL